MMLPRSIPTFLSAALLATLLSGCGSDDNNTDPPTPGTDPAPSAAPDLSPAPTPDPSPDPAPDNSMRTIEIDASAGGFRAPADDPKKKYTYFDLDTGAIIELTDAEAESNMDWDVAFKRTKPKINGGASGPGSAKGALADAQDEFYDTDGSPNASTFFSATPEFELASFEAVTTAEGLDFSADRKSPEIVNDGGEKSWFSYDHVTHSLSANPNAWNLVRGADGSSYAKMHVTEIVQADRAITVDMYIQGAGETAFDMNPTTFTATLGADGGAACYDFDTKAEVDCTTAAAEWDIQIEVAGRSWNIWTNGGLRGDGSKGGRFGTVSAETIGNYPDAESVPKFFADAPSGVLLDSPTRWYAYSLQGNHKLWPNYRVYVIDTGDNQFKVQILGYYDASGTSGFITLRYAGL